MALITKSCTHCGKLFEADSREHNRGNAKYCSRECSHQAKKRPAKQCPVCGTLHRKEGDHCSRRCGNTGRKHTEETKQLISSSMRILRDQVCQYCGTQFQNTRIHKYCSVNCSHSARKDNYRKNRNQQLNYRHDCRFQFALNEYPDEFDFTLIEQHGWYTAKNRGGNTNGVSRDHMVSVKWGYENGIDPSIISHPANCQLLRHNENVSKGKKNAITIDELMVRISEWDKKYPK